MIVIDANAEDWKRKVREAAYYADETLQRIVAETIEAVRTRGDEALLELGRRFDSAHLESISVSQSEIEKAMVAPSQLEAMQAAFNRVLDFHAAQMSALRKGWTRSLGGWDWRMPTENVGQKIRPLQTVGLYVPGGLGSYPSSVFMLAGPAHKAEVKRLIFASPCGPDGHLSQSVLVAMRLARADKVFAMGGASAVAALAFGTESVERVDKVAGPGNKFVNEAKRQLWGTVGLDGLYGPSEVCVLIDETSNSAYAAADLLAQIEHAPDNLGFVVSVGQEALERLRSQIQLQLDHAPRANILRECLKNVRAFVVNDLYFATDVVNEIAPEHLSLAVKDPGWLTDRIVNAGCVLVGDWTPESAADFCLGPSHTIPTGGAVRFASPINVLDFLKIQSVSNLSHEQLKPLIPVVESMAQAEGFPAHGYAATVRRTEEE